MRDKHYRGQLSAFVNHQLSKHEQQEIAEHLMHCADCRREHDRIKLGSSLAMRLEQRDAPVTVWNEIENALDGERSPHLTLIPRASFFGARDLAGYAVALVLVAGLVAAAYVTLFRSNDYVAHKEARPPEQIREIQAPQQNTELPYSNIPANAEQANTNTQPPGANTNVPAPELASVPSWRFDTIAGTPKVGSASSVDRLAVGDYLETDAASKAKITVADIGSVEIEPNSRVRLVGTNPREHRLSLERGALYAQIAAPPRLFIVDTPSAVAVDLGCSYKLEVDKAGNSYLHVTTGFVSLERGGRESIVPAGAMCVTKRGRGLGTPFASETTETFKAALERFDFAGGGSRAVQVMLDNRGFYDIITLWHLLSRVQRADREKIYDALAGYVQPPAGVTREGVLSLDKEMLELWRADVESVWFQ